MMVLPAGIPRGFRWVRHRVSARLRDAPLLFLGVVLGVALVFRVAIGWARDASNEPVADPAAAAPAAPTEAKAATATPSDAPSSEAPTTATATNTPRPMLPKRKPRTHGRR